MALANIYIAADFSRGVEWIVIVRNNVRATVSRIIYEWMKSKNV